ncbi:MAG: serine--tRNA ligase [Candidatus Micrarchaeota archaeon]
MLNIHAIRQDPKPFYEALRARNASDEPIKDIIELDSRWRGLKAKNEELKHERNEQSKKINEAKKSGKDTKSIIGQTQQISSQIKELDAEQKELEAQMEKILLTVPNVPHSSAPKGKDESNNVQILKWGEPKIPKGALPHYEIGEKLGIDFERGAKLAGSRFAVLKGDMARLERALAYYMLQTAISHGYTEILPPYMVNTKTMEGTGQLPKFSEELYKLEGTDYWLIPTAEVPLINLHAGEVLEESSLPLSYCALTPCFRKEAGNYQKDIKGIIRQHQFHKVELVKFTTPERSYDELGHISLHAQEVLKGLNLPYRVIELCAGDLGFAACKTYDIEVWLPSQNTYREISSCSNCEDFQARRANIKLRRDGKNEYVHTLNGSGLAVGRTMVAILENFQEDGSILIPKALQSFMGKDVVIQ